jgi:hypothetical protein
MLKEFLQQPKKVFENFLELIRSISTFRYCLPFASMVSWSMGRLKSSHTKEQTASSNRKTIELLVNFSGAKARKDLTQ